MTFRSHYKTALVAMALAAGTSLTAHAANVTINDLTDSITVSTDGDPAAISIQGDSDLANEFLHFTFTSTRVNTAASGPYAAEFFETDGTTPSDFFLINATNGSAVLDVQFFSDPATFPNVTPNATIVENGTSQGVVSYFGGTGEPVDNFFVASDAGDVGDTPEPASMILMGTALLAVAPLRKVFAR